MVDCNGDKSQGLPDTRPCPIGPHIPIAPGDRPIHHLNQSRVADSMGPLKGPSSPGKNVQKQRRLHGQILLLSIRPV